MTGPIPLSAIAHAALRYDRQAAGAARRIARIGLSELAFAAADMPLCLAKDGQTGRFNLIALMALVESDNLFAFGGGFQATYVPRFALLGGFRRHDGGAGGLAIDPADPTIGGSGEPLFDHGAPTALVGRVRAALDTMIEDMQAAQTLVDRYAAHDLIRPLTVSIALADGTTHDLAGLYTIDEQAVRDLSDSALVALHRADALGPAAVMTASLAQAERLRQLHNARFAPAIDRVSLG